MYADLRSQWIVLTCLASLFDRPGGRLVAELSMVVKLCENVYMGGVTFDRKIKRSDLNVVISRPRLFHVFLCS